MLYGLQLSSSNRSLGIYERFENIHINIVCDVEQRDCTYRSVLGDQTARVKHERVTSAKTKAIDNLFKAGPSEKSGSIEKVVKKEEKSPGKKSAKKQSPKKPSPAETSKKASAAAAKVAAKGNSIATLFGKQAAKPPAQKKKSPEKPVEEETKKRPASPEEVPKDTKPKSRPAAKKFKPAPKKTRLLQIVDSSESEEEETVEKKIEFEPEEVEVEMAEPSPEKKKPERSPQKGTGKSMQKEVVTKTYMDKDGFIGKRDVFFFWEKFFLIFCGFFNEKLQNGKLSTLRFQMKRKNHLSQVLKMKNQPAKQLPRKSFKLRLNKLEL